MPRSLYKTTLVIWSDSDPSRFEISELAREAEVGSSYCSKSQTKLIADVNSDPDWDDTEFFDSGDGDYAQKKSEEG